MLVQPQSLTPALHELSLDNLVLILYCIKFFENWSVVWSSFYFSGPFLNCNHQIGFILTWRIYTHILYESFNRFWSSQLQCNVYLLSDSASLFYRLLRSNNFALNPSFVWIKVLSVASWAVQCKTCFTTLLCLACLFYLKTNYDLF